MISIDICIGCKLILTIEEVRLILFKRLQKVIKSIWVFSLELIHWNILTLRRFSKAKIQQTGVICKWCWLLLHFAWYLRYGRFGERVKIKITKRIALGCFFGGLISGKWLKLSKWIVAFFGKLLSSTLGFNFSNLHFIESSVINSEFILVQGILDSTDSKWMSFNHMSKVEVNVQKTVHKKARYFF